DPYGELSYGGEALPSLLSMNPDGVIYMGSFSKVLAPGLRLGYVVAPEPVFGKMVQAKQAADLHTPSFSQRIVYEAVQDGFIDRHIPEIRTLYANQCQAMLDAMAEFFPAGVTWNKPEGGMFIWVKLPAHIDSMQLLDEAIEHHVAFVPGAPFYANEPEKNTLRLSFVTVPPAKIREGVEKLAKLIAAKMQ
ncbi:MAG TPA: PLP-dependent aminotransferase family protein, partial [Oxalicibacterium sp.]